MKEAPDYFERIRRKASQRWAQLEKDRELAGPWHMLFMQVQSPRHVVSELLQNADDVGASEASVCIEDGEFVFTHNGRDFVEDEFASLCRFGYSNKRALHTIGFRGVGFKSTFSLGDEVRLFTPSLSVAFHPKRFTEPVWLQRKEPFPPRTEIRVAIQDQHRLRELEKNLAEWRKSPASLLFFRSIRCLQIEQHELRWISHGPGPIAGSEWVALSTSPEKQHLLLASSEEEFHDDALEEIRQERMLGLEEELQFPPCRIEILLGLEGRLFVILPTGVKTDLPFACNAPFVQDPAREKIKDPEISPTNRWLLERAGHLAAEGMLDWLGREDLPAEKRAEAYTLMPDVDRNDHSLQGCCATTVEEAFDDAIDGKRFLLTEEGTLASWGQCISVPPVILGVWKSDQVSRLFDKSNRPILCQHVPAVHKDKLSNWGCIERLDKSDVLEVLESKHLPKPDTWRQLMALWFYVSGDLTGYYNFYKHSKVCIVPVQGKKTLYAANEVARLGEKKLLQSQEDWDFLSEHLIVVNPNWLRFLTEQRRKAEQLDDRALGEQLEAVYSVLNALRLHETSDASRVINQVAEKLFGLDMCFLNQCVQLAQIAAKLGATVQESFRFVTRNENIRTVHWGLVANIDRDLDRFVEDEWYDDHALHEDYWREFKSCNESEWLQWIESNRSGLLTFVPITSVRNSIWGRWMLRVEFKKRGISSDPIFPYVTDSFVLEDWDFEEEHWSYWDDLSEENEEFWGQLFKRILSQSKGFWSKTLTARALQIATTGNEKPVTPEQIPSSWIVKFRSLPCLQDTRGRYRKPAELLRRTQQTEALLEVEPFLRAEYDTEQTRPLLIRLGVRDTPTGPDRLLDRLRALATIANPPVFEVEKWYHRLDQMLDKCSTDEFHTMKEAFARDKIILTEGGTWVTSSEVFLVPDEDDVPGAPILHSSVRDLTLWRKIGIAERPTVDLALHWLKNLDSGKKLSPEEVKRVRSLLSKYPLLTWTECGHWLNLEGEWTHVHDLEYKLTMQSLLPWRHLFPAIKRKTADLQHISSATSSQEPFSELASLSTTIEDRLMANPHQSPAAQSRAWLRTLGAGLVRVELEKDEETLRVWELAERMSKTLWQTVSTLEVAPYIRGTPAGTPRMIDALWNNEILYVKDRPVAQLFKAVAQELARPFDRSDIADAVKACVDRSPEFVMAYLEENFKLMPADQSKPANLEKSANNGLVEGNCESQIDETHMHPETLPSPDIVRDDQPVHEFGDEDFQNQDENGFRYPQITKARPSKPRLIERWALARGYSRDGSDDRYYHSDGSWIEKVTGTNFPWERYSPSGELLQCYWVKEHCIERDPLQMEADAWELCAKHSEKYTLVLTALDGTPVEYSGKRICELRDTGRLVLYPASYRLVYDHDGRLTQVHESALGGGADADDD